MLKRAVIIALLSGLVLGPIGYQIAPSPNAPANAVTATLIGLALLALYIVGRIIEPPA